MPSGPISIRDVAFSFSDGMSAVRLNGQWGYVDAQGEMVIPPQYENASVFAEGLVDATDAEGKVGYIDHQGKWVISPRFYVGDAFVAGQALVSDEQQQAYRYIDKTGQVILGPQADVRYSTNRWEKTRQVEMKEHYYRLSQDGKTLNGFPPFKAEDALTHYPLTLMLYRRGNSAEGLIPACRLALCGYVSYDGQWVIPPRFGEVGRFLQGRAIVSENDLHGIIDREGRWVMGPMPAEDFKIQLPDDKDAYEVLDKNQGWQTKSGWFDDSGNFVTAGFKSPKYTLPDGWRYSVDARGIADIVDRDGRSLIQAAWSRDVGEQQPQQFSILRVFPANSPADVRSILLSHTPQAAGSEENVQPQLLVFLPRENRILVQDWKYILEKFPVVRLSSENYGSYSKDSPDILLFADTGEYLWDKNVSYIPFFENQVGFARLDATDNDPDSEGGYLLLDRQGRYLLGKQRFSDVEREFSSGIAWARSAQTGLWGAIDNTGKQVIPFEYHDPSPFQGNYAFVRTSDGKRWVVDTQNKRYDWVQNIAARVARVATSDTFFFRDQTGIGLIRGDGAILIPAGRYEDMTPLSRDRLRIRLQDKEGMADLEGREIIPPEYKRITAVDSDSMFDSEKQIRFFALTHAQTGRKAVVDAEGRFLTEFDIQSVHGNLADGMLLIADDGVRMLLPDGKLLPVPSTLVISNQVSHHQLLDDGTILVELGDVKALADPQGRPGSAWYNSMTYFEPGFWRAEDISGTRILDAQGSPLYFLPRDQGFVTGMVHDTTGRQPRMLIVAELKKESDYSAKTVLIDPHEGQIVQTLSSQVNLLYKTVVDNLMPVGYNNRDGKAGFYDLQGKLRLSIPGFSPTSMFHDQRAIMVSDVAPKNGRPLVGIIDTEGRWIVRPKHYIDIEPYAEQRTWARTGNGEFHLLNTQGQVLGKMLRRCNQDVWINAKGKVAWPQGLPVTCK